MRDIGRDESPFGMKCEMVRELDVVLRLVYKSHIPRRNVGCLEDEPCRSAV